MRRTRTVLPRPKRVDPYVVENVDVVQRFTEEKVNLLARKELEERAARKAREREIEEKLKRLVEAAEHSPTSPEREKDWIQGETFASIKAEINQKKKEVASKRRHLRKQLNKDSNRNGMRTSESPLNNAINSNNKSRKRATLDEARKRDEQLHLAMHQREEKLLPDSQDERNVDEEHTDRFCVVAVYAYKGSEGDLVFEKDDVIEVLKRSDNGWWYGRNLHSGSTGYLPENFVKRVEEVDDENAEKKTNYAVGDCVDVRLGNSHLWFEATVQAIHEDGKYSVRMLDSNECVEVASEDSLRKHGSHEKASATSVPPMLKRKSSGNLFLDSLVESRSRTSSLSTENGQGEDSKKTVHVLGTPSADCSAAAGVKLPVIDDDLITAKSTRAKKIEARRPTGYTWKLQKESEKRSEKIRNRRPTGMPDKKIKASEARADKIRNRRCTGFHKGNADQPNESCESESGEDDTCEEIECSEHKAVRWAEGVGEHEQQLSEKHLEKLKTRKPTGFISKEMLQQLAADEEGCDEEEEKETEEDGGDIKEGREKIRDRKPTGFISREMLRQLEEDDGEEEDEIEEENGVSMTEISHHKVPSSNLQLEKDVASILVKTAIEKGMRRRSSIATIEAEVKNAIADSIEQAVHKVRRKTKPT